MMSINDLPPELLDSIFEYLSPPSNRFSHSNLPLYFQTYLLLTLVCKRWNEIGTPLLYTAARLSKIEQYSAFQRTLVSTNLGQHLKCLRMSTTEWTKETKPLLRVKSSELLASLFFGSYTPNLEELYIAGNQTINLSRLSALKKLKKLVIWGARLKLSSSPTSPIFPSLNELSLCGVKELVSISSLFNPTTFPSLDRIALCYSQIPNDNFLSLLPSSTLLVISSNIRRSLGQEANETTLYTNRFYSILEGYTDFAQHASYPQYLQLTDIEGLTHSTFLSVMEVIGDEGVRSLELVMMPQGCWRDEEEKRRVEEWGREKGVKVVWEREGDYMHESLVPASFVRVCEEKKRNE